MKTRISLLLTSGLVAVSFLKIQAQTAPAKLWDKTLGGNYGDGVSQVKQTSDGGYIVAGISDSNIFGDKSQNCRGGADYWVVKSDANGNKLWDKTFGNNRGDLLRSVQQTSDGGYILAGSSSSDIGNEKTQACIGNADYWVIKTDALGNKIWDKTIGGYTHDELTAVLQTSDGGYLLGGYSESGQGAGKSQPSRGYKDYWVVKLNASGTKVWDKTYGGSQDDVLNSMQATHDGGFILGGNSSSGIGNEKSEACRGNFDYWLVKIDGAGNKLWDKTFGGADQDFGGSVQQTHDRDFIIGGTSYSGTSGEKTQNLIGFSDYWVVKVDGSGNKIWDKSFGGTLEESFINLQQTADRNFILGGYSGSGIGGNKTQANKGSGDYWLLKIDFNGNFI